MSKHRKLIIRIMIALGSLIFIAVVVVTIDKPLPEIVINNDLRRKNRYSFLVNDSGVINVCFE